MASFCAQTAGSFPRGVCYNKNDKKWKVREKRGIADRHRGGLAAGCAAAAGIGPAGAWGTSGIETAQQLRRADPKVLIVFVTSSPEYVWDAFPVHPFDYLLKPYEEEKFRKLAAELRRVLCRTEPELEVRIARQTVQLPLRKVLYAMAQNHFVRVVSEDGECRAACGFAQVEEKLRTEENFMSCNRGIVINMDKVLRFEDDCIEMLDGTRLPVRQKDKNALFAHFTQYQFRHMRREL